MENKRILALGVVIAVGMGQTALAESDGTADSKADSGNMSDMAMGDGDKALSRYMTALPTPIHGQKTSATLASCFARLMAQASSDTSAHQRAACMKGLFNIFFA